MAERMPWMDYPDVAPMAPAGVTMNLSGEAIPDTSAREMAADVAKAVPSKLAEGAAKLPGLPGDLRHAFLGGLEWLHGHIVDNIGVTPERAEELKKNLHGAISVSTTGINPETGEKLLNFSAAPTSLELKEAIEKKTGASFYEPQSETGKLLGNAAEFVPSAVALGPARGVTGAVSNALKLGVAPGLASEAGGQVFEGSPLETPARLAGALAGTVAAHGASRLGDVAGNYGVARSIAKETQDLLGTDVPITPGAVKRMAGSIEADKLTPAAVQAKLGELGPEAMTMDMGRQLQGRAEAIATQPGAGQNRILDAVENRTGPYGGAAASRIKGTLDTHMGPSPDVVDVEKRLTTLIDQKAKPLYDKVMSDHPVVWDARLAELAERPSIKTAMGNAYNIAKDYGEVIDQTAKPSLRYWDYVKKDLDARINGIMRSGGMSDLNSQQKAEVGGMMKARTDLREYLDSLTGGEYAQARKVAATKPELKEAAEFGRSALNTKLLKEEFADTIDNMSTPQKLMAAAHFRREVDRIIDTARNDGAAARRILDTNENAAKIEHMFGPQAREAIENRVAAENEFQRAKDAIAGNSRTAVRGELRKDTVAPAPMQLPSATLLGYLEKGARGAASWLHGQGIERTRNAIGEMSTAQGQTIPKLVDLLAGYNTRTAPELSAGAGPAAKRLAAILAARQLQAPEAPP